MKVVILAGGKGTRISEETHSIPKPMVRIGEWPILWHIMKNYSHFGFNDFAICLGYKGYVIKEYFANYMRHNSDMVVDMEKNEITLTQRRCEPWKISLIDTGEDTMTGGRIARLRGFLEEDSDDNFMLTYGDGLSNVCIGELVEFHKAHGKLATVTAVQPPGRFGALDIAGDQNVRGFQEKPAGDGGFINGGFFVLNKQVFKYIENSDDLIWERQPLQSLASDGELFAFTHKGFWQPMDTLRDKLSLESEWNSGEPKWKLWT